MQRVMGSILGRVRSEDFSSPVTNAEICPGLISPQTALNNAASGNRARAEQQELRVRNTSLI